MTKEHIPPKSTGNSGHVESRSLSDGADVVQYFDGYALENLCGEADNDCNNAATKMGYIAAYEKWESFFHEQARNQASSRRPDPLDAARHFEIKLDYDLEPGKFVRQVLGMFLASQNTERLFTKAQSIVDLIQRAESSTTAKPKPAKPGSIDPWKLYLGVTSTNPIVGGSPIFAAGIKSQSPQTIIPGSMVRSGVSELYLMSLKPFVFVLTDKELNDELWNITNWTQMPTNGKGSRLPKGRRQLKLPTPQQIEDRSLGHLIRGRHTE